MNRRRAVLRRLAVDDPRAVTSRLPLHAPEWVRAALANAAAAISPDVAWTAWVVGAAVVCMGAAIAGGAGLVFLAAIAVTAAPLLALRGRRGRALQLLEGQLPSGLEAVARALRSGASLRQAVGEAASCGGVLGADLAAVAVECGQGVALIEALERWQARRSTPGVRLAVAALSLSAETGGAQARAVDGVAATMRDRLAVAAEVRAHAAQVRASVLVINLAPIAFCAFASATDPRTSTLLFRTPLGWAFLTAGFSLDALSALWMRRLARVPS